MKNNTNKLEIIQDVFEKHLGSRIKELERSNNKQTTSLELCYYNIEYMKSKFFNIYKILKRSARTFWKKTTVISLSFPFSLINQMLTAAK